MARKTSYIKTPSLDLNRVLSGDLYKGIPERTMVGITGPEHSFKSSFACLCAANAVQQGYTPIIIDTENAMTTEFCERWGLDTTNAIYISTIWIEEVMSVLVNIKESGLEKMIIILDSVGGLDRKKMWNDAMNNDPKIDQGQLQRTIRSLMKILTNICMESNSIVVFTAHLFARPGMGSIPMPDDVSGGKAVKLFPSILINLKKQSLKKDEKSEMSIINALVVKNRFYPPFQEATIDISYQNGINPVAGLSELLLPDKANILKKEGNSYYYVDSGEKYATYDRNLEEKLKTDTEILDQLNEWLKTTGYSTVNENVKEAEELELELDEIEETKPTKKKKK